MVWGWPRDAFSWQWRHWRHIHWPECDIYPCIPSIGVSPHEIYGLQFPGTHLISACSLSYPLYSILFLPLPRCAAFPQSLHRPLLLLKPADHSSGPRHPLHFCVDERVRIRIRKIYHQQLKASWVWDLFSHILKRLWANANRSKIIEGLERLKVQTRVLERQDEVRASPSLSQSHILLQVVCRRIWNVVKRTCTWFP